MAGSGTPDRRSGPDGAETTTDSREAHGGAEGVVATAECGVCAKPIVQRAVLRWVHADGKTYRHGIEPYFVHAEPVTADARIVRLLAYLDQLAAEGPYQQLPLTVTHEAVRRILAEEPADA